MKQTTSSAKNVFNLIWDAASLTMFILGMILIFKSCSQEYESTVRISKIDSIYSDIISMNKKIDSLQETKKTLILKEKTIHEEHHKTVERILLAPDSSQYLITEELIRDHKQLDSSVL